jgi:hypothetical protein
MYFRRRYCCAEVMPSKQVTRTHVRTSHSLARAQRSEERVPLRVHAEPISIQVHREIIPLKTSYRFRTRGVFRLTSSDSNISLNQAQNLPIKFKSGESLIFVVFFFNLMPDPLSRFSKNRLLCSSFLTPVCVLKVTFVFYLIFN